MAAKTDVEQAIVQRCVECDGAIWFQRWPGNECVTERKAEVLPVTAYWSVERKGHLPTCSLKRKDIG